ncbi:PTS transporter subunit EIIC [Mesoplasma corruscae]|uniref:PTS system mannitol-specific EIICB component n=1 Tax=Mesoplasma corruscae TaxID=216874 RepID=A0A2S5RH78_9MOLU|nr:PTS transporter subunit EIIC [Mesoplasma corruscae]PPE06648.1 PTS system, mannitol-specific IIBC component [Mesoplasma corruscae]
MKEKLSLEENKFLKVEKSLKGKNFKLKVQKVGSFMAGMIMPSIGVLLAWGLWTAMFLYDYDNNKPLGWFNAPMLGRLVDPGLKYLIPILIAFNGARMIYGIRGGMLATFVILGTIIGTDWIYANHITLADGSHPGSPNQFIGAMVVGPLSGWFLKKMESFYLEKINKSYEMLVKNFGIGFFGILLALVTFFGWGWIMWGITWTMIQIISLFGSNKWLAPLMGIFTEPVKVSFLNNALNHGVMGPIGYNEIAQQTAEGLKNPRSIFFLFDPNPGPGLGMLLAYICFTKGENRYNAAGSSLIHAIGGIHEVYFVFILAKPKMLIATMLGVVGSQFITSYLGGGTIATPSPGSIISLVALSPGLHALLINLLSVLVGVLIAFGISALLLITDKNKGGDESMNFQLTDEGISFNENKKEQENTYKKDFQWINVKTIVFACEAGMGSSAMAAGIVSKWVKQNNLEIKVTNIAVKELNDSYDVVVTMQNFKTFAEQKAPNSYIYPIQKFMGPGVYDELYKNLTVQIEKRG